MIKKKVSVKSKEPTDDLEVKDMTKPLRGRPKSKTIDSVGNVKTTATPIAGTDMPRIPSSRVFSVSIEKTQQNIYKTNNIIKLKISNVAKLERRIAENKGLLFNTEDDKWSDLESLIDAGEVHDTSSTLTQDYLSSNLNLNVTLNSNSNSNSNGTLNGNLPSSLGLEHFVKRKNVQLPVAKQTDVQANRKDLIINSGIKRVSSEPLQVFSDSWPMTSPYACWYCCHTFDTTPVGIPSVLTNYMFKCYGNFCSYNCAKRYLCPLKDDEDDMACMQSSNEIFKCDDHGDKLQLLELLYHLETNAELDDPIKIAPRRLILKLFGGNKTIEEFRKSFRTNTTYHTFKMPLVSMAYHMEECVDTKSDTRRKFKNMSLDVAKLEKAYEEIMKEKTRNSKLTVQKSIMA